MSIEAMKQDPFGYFQYSIQLDAWVQNREKNVGTAFYAVPPQHEWVGLTDEEIYTISADDEIDLPVGVIKTFASIIEAKLRGKNIK